MSDRDVDDALQPYAALGGDAGVRAIVDGFYDLMDSLPEAATIRAMHPGDLSGSRQKLYEFLSGWTGGPQLYWERHGHPALRRRHMRFPIDSAARDAWLLCMGRTLEEHVADEALRRRLYAAFAELADRMRNLDA